MKINSNITRSTANVHIQLINIWNAITQKHHALSCAYAMIYWTAAVAAAREHQKYKPVGWVSEIADFLQIINTVQVRKHGSCMLHKIRKQVVHMTWQSKQKNHNQEHQKHVMSASIKNISWLLKNFNI